jgi:ABC-type transport system involved in multi-copper enzyme maturation permease subunit
LRYADQIGRFGLLEAMWKNDLPERFDPMMAKELRQCMRRSSFVYPFLAIQLFAVVAMITEFQIGSAAESSPYTGMLNPWLLWSSGPFWMLVAGICLVIMPLGGLILMGQELEEGNHELLLLTKLDRWKVVLGKFITLWGLCALTFISLLPYVVVRYMIGGIEWWHEAACAGTVLGGSAIACAGTIGASAFKRVAARIAVLVLFLFSMLAGCGGALAISASVTRGCGVIYHLTALAAVICYTVMGLILARSRLRLTVLAYEMNPSTMTIGLLIFAPFLIGLVSAFSLGYGGFAGLLGMAFLACSLDKTFKAPKSMAPPLPNLPPPLPDKF